MSRIGKLPVPIPKGVKVQISGTDIKVNGPLGNLSFTYQDCVSVKQENEKVFVLRKDERRKSSSVQGLTRTLINNMIVGVSKGFTRELEIVGVGYRAEVKGNALVLSVGYSHPVEMQLPKGIEAKVEKNTRIMLSGYDRESIGQFAANVRAVRPPEPYKGKGIKYLGEIVRRKVGKTSG